MTPNIPAVRARAFDAKLIALVSLLVLALIPLLYTSAFRGRIFPGVYASGLHLGGIAPTDALEHLDAQGFDPTAPVVLRAEAESWEVSPTDAGILLDTRETVTRAYSVGRQGNRASAVVEAVRARLFGAHIAPVVTIDTHATSDLLGGLADEYDRAALDAGFAIEGTAVVGRPAAPGRALDIDGGIAAVRSAVESGEWPLTVELPVQSIEPAIVDASAAMQRAESLLAAPFHLAHQDQEWLLAPEILAPMLLLTVDDSAVGVAIDEARLAEWLQGIAGEITTPPENPRFTFDAETGRLRAKKQGAAGTRVDPAATAQGIMAAASTDRRVQLSLTESAPELTNNLDGRELGITALLHEETSFFVGSPAARIHNIGLAADRFDGILIPPGATFSFNQQLGDVSAEVGYKETLIIMDGTTADGVGGGVCQVSTTLFRAAFWTGLPIVERHAHGYRVAYYEQGNQPPGLDATIYSPVVDLKFQNDTDGWMLIEAATDPQRASLTFKVYGSPSGRTVELEGPTVGGHVPAPPSRVEVDPSLSPGESRTLEHARAGASVSLVRVVKENDEERRDTFNSRYRPTGSVVAIGPDSPTADPGNPAGESGVVDAPES